MGAQNPSICFSPPPATHGAAVLHCTSVPGLVRAKLPFLDNELQFVFIDASFSPYGYVKMYHFSALIAP